VCGIAGYVGDRCAQDVLLDGLRRLEYRGYDSAGLALVGDGGLTTVKRSGKLVNLEKTLAELPTPTATLGVGHTRWATHGAPTDRNAHPHRGANGRVAIVHNGIIENFAELRLELQVAGRAFSSDTDSEVAAQLLESIVERGADLTTAVQLASQRLEGAFTLVAVDAMNPDVIVASRRNSPLVVGLGDGETFLGSDVAAFVTYTRRVLEVEQDQIVTISREGAVLTDFEGRVAEGRSWHVDWDLAAVEKDGHDWFMRKEIFEQPKAVADSLLGRTSIDGRLRLDELRISEAELITVDKVVVIACGTSHYAGMVAKYAIEHWARIPVEVELASEFRYRDPILGPRTLVVAISQSGETADTLQAIRHARRQSSRVVTVCNTLGSSIPRESDGVIYTHAGPEIGVASTKGFLTQLVACYLIGLYLGQLRGAIFRDEVEQVLGHLDEIPGQLDQLLSEADRVYDLVGELLWSPSFLFLGRHAGFPVALEGALKLKEVAYVHAEGFAAGELKHGPIALVEQGIPVFCVVPPRGREVLRDKMISNIQEVRARGALTICLAEEGDERIEPYADHLIRLPGTSVLLQPLLAAVPLQLFACELATRLGHDVDQPRNLAKSVTVE
jgi:glucosamine--fructose-6-phosphate aminotransferase (isomerizing)